MEIYKSNSIIDNFNYKNKTMLEHSTTLYVMKISSV